jgi:hypothetical protein
MVGADLSELGDLKMLKRFNPNYAAPKVIKDKTGWAEPIKNMTLSYLNNRPRSVQTSLGPSSACNPCDRALVGMMSGFEGQPDSNPWLAGVGTAVHLIMADMLEEENRKAGREIWLVEKELPIKPPAIPKGHGDGFHIPTGMVLDWKILGKTSLDEISKNGPSDTYRTQLHIYGLGYWQLGYKVESVLLACLPRNANPNLPFLHEAVFWKEDFDMDHAVQAVERVEKLHTRARELKATSNIKKLQLVPATPGKACFFCPFKGNKTACPDAVDN